MNYKDYSTTSPFFWESTLTKAAPDLLKASKEALDWLLPADPGSSRYRAGDKLRKAIEKAERR